MLDINDLIAISWNALAYLLSDNGYDIWLGNTRGNDHSHDHKTLSSTSKEYWNFSWHEIGYYDIPAMIDYVLEQTNSSGVYYVGHSQGTTTFTVMLATRPEYNRKIIQSHLLAPAVFMKNFPHLVKHVYNEYLVKFFGGPEGYIDVSGNSSLAFVELTANFFCQGQTPIMGFCEALMVSVCGMNVNGVQCDPRILPTLMSHLSHYASIKQAIHFMQNYQNGGFRQFDHQGDNMKIYGSASPPSYNLKNIKAPTYIYSGSCDILVSEQDVKRLKNALANVRELKSFKNYNHCDFNYGKNSRAVYQNDMLKAMNSAKN